MHVDVRKSDDIVIVDLTGKLVAGIGDELLRDVLNELLAEDWKKILLNLSEVSTIDSSGIGELVAGLKISGTFGADLKLLRIDEGVEHVLSLSHVLPLFQVYDNEQAALDSFAAEASPTS